MPCLCLCLLDPSTPCLCPLGPCTPVPMPAGSPHARVHAHWTPAHHACAHARWIPACRVRARWIPACRVHARWIPAHRVCACWIPARLSSCLLIPACCVHACARWIHAHMHVLTGSPRLLACRVPACARLWGVHTCTHQAYAHVYVSAGCIMCASLSCMYWEGYM